MHELPSQPFPILLSNFFAEAMHQPEQMMAANATDPPTAVMTAEFSPHNQHLVGTLRE